MPALHQEASGAAGVLVCLLGRPISRLYNQGDAHGNPILGEFSVGCALRRTGRISRGQFVSVGRRPASRWTAPLAGSYYLLYGIYLKTGVGFRASTGADRREDPRNIH